MTERVKSGVLVILVLSSLFLTYYLWYWEKPLEVVQDDLGEPIHREETRSLDQIITPRWIKLNQHGQPYRLTYGEDSFHSIWNAVSELLQSQPYWEQGREGLNLHGKPDLVFIFQPPLPVGQGAPWLGGQGSHMEVNEIQLVISGDRETAVALLKEVGETEKIHSISITREDWEPVKTILASIDKSSLLSYRELTAGKITVNNVEVALAEDLPVHPGEVMLGNLILQKEDMDQERIMKTFFLDRSLVRVISERDGTKIFTDGEKGLRIKDMLEYSHPQLWEQPTTMNYMAALSNAGRLLSQHGGWPGWMRLEKLEAGSNAEAWSALWVGYYRGLPVYGGETEVAFNDSGMIKYQRSLYVPGMEVGNLFLVKSYREALEAAGAIIDEDNKEKTVVIEELSLGYWVDINGNPVRAVPVWQVHVNETELILCARDLNVLWEGLE